MLGPSHTELGKAQPLGDRQGQGPSLSKEVSVMTKVLGVTRAQEEREEAGSCSLCPDCLLHVCLSCVCPSVLSFALTPHTHDPSQDWHRAHLPPSPPHPHHAFPPEGPLPG